MRLKSFVPYRFFREILKVLNSILKAPLDNVSLQLNSQFITTKLLLPSCSDVGKCLTRGG
jgi:hypothetical protein